MPGNPILCVDDDPHTLALLREMLQHEYPLVFASNGERALQAVKKFNPRLILLDVKMPKLGGYTVCRTIKANPYTADIPVIFITSLVDSGNELEGFEAGGVDYITKPFTAPMVLARVRAHLSLVSSIKLENSYREAIYMLRATRDYDDAAVGMQNWRVGNYSKSLAQALEWPKARVDMMEMAASVHDIGMFAVPAEIRNKPGPLEPQEFESVKTHTRIGCDILNRSEASLFRLAAEIALNHHERWDGKGYPSRLKGKNIPESARLVAITSVFHAL